MDGSGCPRPFSAGPATSRPSPCPGRRQGRRMAGAAAARNASTSAIRASWARIRAFRMSLLHSQTQGDPSVRNAGSLLNPSTRLRFSIEFHSASDSLISQLFSSVPSGFIRASIRQASNSRRRTAHGQASSRSSADGCHAAHRPRASRTARHVGNRREGHRRTGSGPPRRRRSSSPTRPPASSARSRAARKAPTSRRSSCPAATRSSRSSPASGRSSGRGLVLQVGNTLTVNLTLSIGALEENVTVTGSDRRSSTSTSARVGGNVGTAELSELPAMNRNYFSTVALLPGVQFSPSNQMGNDTIVAGGQTSQNNNVVGGRRLQRRRRAGHQFGRAGAHAARSGPGIPGAHQHVRRGVRPRQRRDRQRGQQGRAPTSSGRHLRILGEQRADGRGLLRRTREPREADDDPARMGRRASAGRSSRTRRTSSSASSGRSTTRTARRRSRRGRT